MKNLKSNSDSKSDRFLYLISAILFVILGGLWIPVDRFRPTNKEPSFEAAAAPSKPATVNATSKPTPQFNAEFLSDPQLMIEYVKQDDGDTVRSALEARLRTFGTRPDDDDNFKSILFEQACEHNASKVIAVLGQSQGTIKAISPERMGASFRKLIEKRNFVAIESILNSRFNFDQFPFLNYFVKEEFARSPWNEALISRFTSRQEYQFDSQVAELLKIALDGDQNRWNWLVDKLRNRSINYVLEAFVRENPPNSSNISRLIDLMPFYDNRDYFLNDCYRKGLLNKSHFPSIAKLYRGRYLPKETVNLLYLQDPEVAREWIEGNKFVRLQVQSDWYEAKDLRKFESCLEAIRPFTKMESGWTLYNHQNIDIDRWNWLWDHGFRPGSDASPVTILILSILQKDIALFRTTITDSSPGFQYFLESGLPVTRETELSPDENRVFVPLLEAIRTWNLEAVESILKSHRYDWQKWKHANPVATAMLANKPDIVSHLIAAGVPLDAVSAEKLKKKTKVDLSDTLLQMGTPADGTTEQFAISAAIEAAKNGNLINLGKAIESVNSYVDSTNIQNRDPKKSLSLRDSIFFSDKFRQIVLAAVDQPRCLEMLQFQGFPIDATVLQGIMRVGNHQSLVIAMRDIQTRSEIPRNQTAILAAAKNEEMATLFLNLANGRNVPSSNADRGADGDVNISTIPIGFEPHFVKSSGSGRYVVAWGPHQNDKPTSDVFDDLAVFDLSTMDRIASTTVANGIISAEVDDSFVYTSPREVPSGPILRMDHKLREIRKLDTGPDRAPIILISSDRLLVRQSQTVVVDTKTFEKVDSPHYSSLSNTTPFGSDCVSSSNRIIERSTWTTLRYLRNQGLPSLPIEGEFQTHYEVGGQFNPNFWGRIKNSPVSLESNGTRTVLPIRQWPIAVLLAAPNDRNARVTLEMLQLIDGKAVFNTILCKNPDNESSNSPPSGFYRICQANDNIVVVHRDKLYAIKVPQVAKEARPPRVFDSRQETEIAFGDIVTFPLRTIGNTQGVKYTLNPTKYDGVSFDEMTGSIRIDTKLLWKSIVKLHLRQRVSQLDASQKFKVIRQENEGRYRACSGKDLPENSMVGELTFFAKMFDGAELLDFIQFSVLIVGPNTVLEEAIREFASGIEK